MRNMAFRSFTFHAILKRALLWREGLSVKSASFLKLQLIDRGSVDSYGFALSHWICSSSLAKERERERKRFVKFLAHCKKKLLEFFLLDLSTIFSQLFGRQIVQLLVHKLGLAIRNSDEVGSFTPYFKSSALKLGFFTIFEHQFKGNSGDTAAVIA